MGTHDYAADPRNASVLVSVNGALVPRAEARVSVFDSGFLLGDGIWESFRLHRGCLVFLDEHLDRLVQGARALDLELGRSRAELTAELYRTVEANGMRDGVHLRLIVTRGIRSTPYQSPAVVVSPPTIVIIPEHKRVPEETRRAGLKLYTVAGRRGRPDVRDPRIMSLSKIVCVQACIQAARAGADEALMLDPHGFVATCNSTNFFIVRRGEVWTSTTRYCLAGITRKKVLELCAQSDIPHREKDFSLVDVYDADEAFVTGSMSGVLPVASVDGRAFAPGVGPLTARLQNLYGALVERVSQEASR